GRGTLDKRIHATAVISGADGYTPIDPQLVAAAKNAPGVKAVAGIRQDGALAYGKQETVNAVDPAAIGALYGDGTLAAARDGAAVPDSSGAAHRLHVGDRITVTSVKGAKLTLPIRAIESTPKLNVLGLGPITMSDATFDRAFDQRRMRLVFADGPVRS